MFQVYYLFLLIEFFMFQNLQKNGGIKIIFFQNMQKIQFSIILLNFQIRLIQKIEDLVLDS